MAAMPPARVLLWVSSLGGLTLLARSLWLGPPPLRVAIGALVAYLGVIAWGIVVPQLEMFGDVIWRGRVGAKRIALTFDDGPHPLTTRRVLALLAERGHKATFFVLGEKVRRFPEVLQEIHQAGHTLGVHGYAHAWLYALLPPSSIARDIARAQDAIATLVGTRPALFRPPIGRVSPRVAAGARRAGVAVVAWTVRGRDGVRQARPERVLSRIIPKLQDGAIILLHDAAEKGNFEPAALNCLGRLLDEIEHRGLATVGVDEFVRELSGPTDQQY